MRKVLFSIFIFSILFSATLLAEDFYYSFGNKMKMQYDTEDSLFYFTNEFDANMGYGKLNFYLNAVTALPEYSVEETSGDPDRILSKNYFLIKMAVLSYNGDNYKATLGDYYHTVGKGLVFSGQTDEELSNEVFLRGIKLNYSDKFFDMTFFGGKQAYVYKDVYVDNSPTEYNEINKTDIVTGSSVSLHFMDRALTTSFNGALYELRKKEFDAISFDYKYDYYPTIVYSGATSFKKDIYNFYFEYAEKHNYGKKFKSVNSTNDLTILDDNYIDEKTGRGWYTNFNMSYGNLGFDFRAMYYNDLTVYNSGDNLGDIRLGNVIYIDPVKANYDDESITETSIVGKDERGFGTQLSYEFNADHNVSTSFAYNFSSGFDEKYFENILEHYYAADVFDITTTIMRKEFSNSAYYEEEINPVFEVSYYQFDSFELKTNLGVKLIKKNKFDGKGRNDFMEFKGYVALSLPYNLKVIPKYEYTEYEEYALKDSDLYKSASYTSIELIKDLSSQHTIKLFVGSERGGKDCSSGSCINKSSFSGVKLTFESYF